GEIGVVLEYGPAEEPTLRAQGVADMTAAPGPIRISKTIDTLDVIGAGNFARSMLLPHLKGNIKLGTVINQTALSANHAKTKFDFAAAGTDSSRAMGSAQNSALLIATRHHLHAPLVKAALSAGRHVFVEKPL